MQISSYNSLLVMIKEQIRTAQHKALISVNTQMLSLYFKIGETISQQQKEQGWGAKVIRKLALDIKSELPEIKGFSYRNISLMVQFYNEYRDLPIVQPVVAQIPWAHNIVLMQKVKDRTLREWGIWQKPWNMVGVKLFWHI